MIPRYDIADFVFSNVGDNKDRVEITQDVGGSTHTTLFPRDLKLDPTGRERFTKSLEHRVPPTLTLASSGQVDLTLTAQRHPAREINPPPSRTSVQKALQRWIKTLPPKFDPRPRR